jgi:hypothetical protein
MSIFVSFKIITLLNNKKTTQLKIGKKLNKHFSKDIVGMIKSHRKRCCTLLAIREIEV